MNHKEIQDHLALIAYNAKKPYAEVRETYEEHFQLALEIPMDSDNRMYQCIEQTMRDYKVDRLEPWP